MKIFKIIIIALVTCFSSAGAWAPNSMLNDAEPQANQRGPDIFIDEEGVIHAVWADYRDDQHVYYTRSADGGASFGSNFRVSSHAGVRADWQQGPVVYARDGHIYVTWNNMGVDENVFIAHSEDEGQSWTERIQVNHDEAQNQLYQDMTVDSEGRIFVTWMEFSRGMRNPGYRIARSEDNAESFDNYILVNEGAPGEVCDCCQPDITVDGQDRIYVSWRNNDDNIRDIYMARSLDNGDSFENPVNVHADNWELNACPSTGPSIKVAGDNVYVSWVSGVDDVWRIWLGISEDGGEWFNNPRILSHQEDADVLQNYPEIALGNEGDVWITWQDDRNGSFDIFTTLSRNYGETFPFTYQVNNDQGDAIQESPVGTCGQDGEYCIIWLDRRHDSDDIFFSAERFRLPEWTWQPFEYYLTTENELVEFDFAADGKLADTLTFSLVRINLPESARLIDNDDRSGYFRWTPGFGDAGNYEFALVLSNGEINDSAWVRIEVAEAESATDGLTNPETHTLLSIFPNPFNGMMKIDFYLPRSTNAEISLFNLGGELVTSLAKEYMSLGKHSIEWSGENIPAGIYFIHFRANSFETISKVILVK